MEDLYIGAVNERWQSITATLFVGSAKRMASIGSLSCHACGLNHIVGIPSTGNILVPCFLNQHISRWQNQGVRDILFSFNVIANSC